MSKLFTPTELTLIRLIVDSGLVDSQSLASHLNRSQQTVKNQLTTLGAKIAFCRDSFTPTGIKWGLAELLFSALQWQRSEYVGDGLCLQCLAAHDDTIRAVGQDDTCFAHWLESKVLSAYAQLEGKAKN